LENYDIISAARTIEDFVINDFSQWHIRRSRRRLQKPESKKELKEAGQTMNLVLSTLSKITAPFVPFLSEKIYQEMGNKNSVHLADWPKVQKELINESLNKKMKEVREIVNLALAERSKAGIKVRQPLSNLQISNKQLEKELIELIKEEVNVKNISFGDKLELDQKITAELKEEGILREVARFIQGMRKKAGYKPSHKILVQFNGDISLNAILEKNSQIILKEIKAEKFILRPQLKDIFDIELETKVDNQKLWLGIKKI
jgi:isoleucyl-tRNA synthetase